MKPCEEEIGPVIAGQIIVDAREIVKRRKSCADDENHAARLDAEPCLRAAGYAWQLTDQEDMALKVCKANVSEPDERRQPISHDSTQLLWNAGEIEIFDEAVDDFDANLTPGKGSRLKDGIDQWIAGIGIGLLHAGGEFRGLHQIQPPPLGVRDQREGLFLQFSEITLNNDLLRRPSAALHRAGVSAERQS